MNSVQKAKNKEMISYFLGVIKTLKSTPNIQPQPKKSQQHIVPTKKNILVLDPYETYISLIDKKIGLILKDLPYLLIMLDTKQVYRIYFISKYLTENPRSELSEIFKLDMDDQGLDENLFYYVGNFANMIPIILINFKTYLKQSLEPSEEEKEIKIIKYSYRMNGCPVRCLDPTPSVKEIEWL